MRAVIMGTDFMKDIDGSFKALETNTNIELGTQWEWNVDLSEFENFVTSNEITEIVLISNEAATGINSDYTLNIDYEEYINSRAVTRYTRKGYPVYEEELSPKLEFSNYLETFCSGSNIVYTKITTDKNSITIPYVEDNDNKLIIRFSYDTTAVIDDTYARDNWEFLKLMYDTDANSIPKCYIEDEELGIDSIGTELRDNGNHPNYCIKKRQTPADNKIYPILLKINDLEELESVKSKLEVDEYLQEFIYNTDDLLDNRVKSYRSIDMIVGGNLNVIQLQVNVTTAMMEVVDNADFNERNSVQPWDRMRYLLKFYNSTNDIGIKLSATEETKVFLPDGTTKFAKNLQLDESVKSIDFATLIPYSGSSETIDSNWSASFTETMNTYTVETAPLAAKEEGMFFGVLITFTTDTNATFSDLEHAKVMVQQGDEVVFKQYQHLEVGDPVLLYDSQTGGLITSVITDINYKMERLIGYVLDFAELDLFLTVEETENQQRYGIVTHNYNYDCYFIRCRFTNYTYGQYCGGGTYFNMYGGFTTFICVRSNTFPGCGFSTEAGTSFSAPEYAGYCNYNKSDISYKKNIELVGKSRNGLNIYQFNYTDTEGLYEGVIAQELIGTEYESALSKNEDNCYVVDYNKIDVKFRRIK